MGNGNGVRTSDRVFVDRMGYRLRKPKRGDLIVFATSEIQEIARRTPSDTEIYYLKRLIGLPGGT